jgi:hypothetical protein
MGTMPESRSSSPAIRQTLNQLRLLLDQQTTGKEVQWYESMNDQLERLEMALDEGASEQTQSEHLKEIARAHPRLISLCDEFQRHGRRLLRQAALVVRLSVRSYDGDKTPFTDLRAATVSLINAVEQYLVMEGELTGEAAQDLGGQG